MSYLQLAIFHLTTVLPAFLIGGYLLLGTKGTDIHKLLGKIYMVLMMVTAATTLFMEARVGPQFLGHFGWIHLLSLLVLTSVPRAWFAIRRGDQKTHMISMIMTYVGGILIAGSFALMPGRLLNDWLFGA
jgi:uncharacterized membrane protein